MTDDYQPSLNKGAFYCTRCGVLSPHKHFELNRLKEGGNSDTPEVVLNLEKYHMGEPIHESERGIKFENSGLDKNWNLNFSVCAFCLKYTIWESGRIIFPTELDTPEPSHDMPNKVKSIYEEAQLIYENSPRSSSALLRLAIETLIPKLNYGIDEKKQDGKNKSLNEMIGELVKKNIPDHIQKGLDVIRYYGNNGIHTAEIDMQDDRESVIFLFKLCNMIVDELISKNNEIDEFYSSIPKKFRSSVEKRDRNKD